MHAILQAPLPIFVMQAILIVVASRLLGVVAKLLGQPLVIAEVVAGILLGPSLLGWLLPGVEATIFPKSSMAGLGLASQVGLILFMFLIGLELDPKLLRGRGRASVVISHSSIVVPFSLGAVLALKLYESFAPPGVRMTPFLLFIGAAMSITAFPVLARILVERRLLKTRIGAVTIACAAVDDVTAWCILAFVVSVARSAGVMEAVKTLVLAFVYILVMLKVVRPALQRWADRTKLGITQNLVAITLVLLLLSSWLTELIGIHALFGAFMFGAILPRQGGLVATLADKLEDLVVVLFLPLFFAYSGLRTQIGLLDTPESWMACAIVIAIACVGKFGGSAVAARIMGLSWRESSAIGVLMNTRGLMELVVLNIGLDLGVISPKLFTMMVIMALVTTFMTTPLLQRIYPTEALLRDLAEEGAPSSTPARYTALVCVSFEHSGPALITLAAAIAGKEHSRLYALRLLAPANRASFVMAQQGEKVDPLAEGGLAPLLDRARELEVEVRPLAFVSGEPARDICDVAEVKRADIVLLGWHKPVFGAAMLSGTVHDVMEGAKPDVGVLVDRGMTKIARILVPYLGSDHDREALQIAKRIAESSGATVNVLEDLTPGAAPSDAVVEEARRGYDLMIIGMGREWGLEHRSFGLQAEAVLKNSPISVLVVRRALAPKSARASDLSPAARARYRTVPEA